MQHGTLCSIRLAGQASRQRKLAWHSPESCTPAQAPSTPQGLDIPQGSLICTGSADMLMDRCLMKAQRNAWHHKPGTAEHEDRSPAQQLPGMPLAPHHGLAGQKDVLLGHDHVSCLVLNGLDHLGVAVARGDNANACKERQGASVQAGVSSSECRFGRSSYPWTCQDVCGHRWSRRSCLGPSQGCIAAAQLCRGVSQPSESICASGYAIAHREV